MRFWGVIMAPHFFFLSIHENQIDGANDQQEGQQVIPMEILVLEHDIGDDAKYGQRYRFLYHLELYEGERTAITFEAQPVGRYLTTIFEEGDTP